MVSKLMLSAAAAALAAAPVAAQAAPQRMAAPVSTESEQLGRSPLLIILAIFIVVALGIVALNGDDDPVSP